MQSGIIGETYSVRVPFSHGWSAHSSRMLKDDGISQRECQFPTSFISCQDASRARITPSTGRKSDEENPVPTHDGY